jgi:hypothetical protein
VLDGRVFEWLLPGNELFTGVKHIRIRASGVRGRPIYLDPYPWGLEIRPRSIREAILFALAQGWSPEGPERRPLFLGYHRGHFLVLPDAYRFTVEVPFLS